MSYIFISYSHEDKDYAHRLEGELKKQRFDTWLDDRIDYGTQWPEEIEERLDNSKVLILIMTPRSKKSEWVQNELNRAKRKRKNIFPLLLEGEEPWLSVEATQYVDVRDGNLPPIDFYNTLARLVPRKLVTPALTTKESPDIFAEALKDQQISPFQKPWEDSADNEAQRKNVVDLIGAGLLLLEGDNLLPSLEKYQLKVGECVISYKGLDIFDQNKSNTYYANLFLKGSNDSELIQKLIDLGWSDIRPGSFTQNLPSILIKEWEKDTDSVDIVKFLIDTNELFSIKPSEIEIARQKENE